jgi:PAS domain S-box-containing protein
VSKTQGSDGKLVKVYDQLKVKEIIVNGISDALMLLDARTFEILDVNQAFLNIYKVSQNQIVGKTCHDITHHLTHPCSQGLKSASCPVERTISTGTMCQTQHVHKDADGNELCFDITAYPLKDEHDQVNRIIHVSRDVTDRIRAEEALKETSEKIKLFAYSIAHDLKSPAAGIYGLTRRLHEKYKDVLDDKGKELCGQILRASEQFAELTDKINVFISSKEVPLKIEWIDLKQIVNMVREETSEQLRTRQIRWSEPEFMPQIKAERMSILRSIRNLVNNALKHGGSDLSQIQIGYEESDGFHVLRIVDDGVGFNMKDSERIFDVFQRNDRSGGIEGAGLGLAIVKEIAERHRGKAWIESGRGRSTNLFFSTAKNLELSEK